MESDIGLKFGQMLDNTAEHHWWILRGKERQYPPKCDLLLQGQVDYQYLGKTQ